MTNHPNRTSPAYDRGYDDGFCDGVNDASPRLLEAAKNALSALDDPSGPGPLGAIRSSLRAAIAEAENRAE